MANEITEHYVTYAPDKQIFYLASGPSSGPLIIFCHGWPGCAEVWSQQAAHFNALGFRTISVDEPGYGNSTTGGPHSSYALETIHTALRAVLASTQRSKAIWIGHDWGATVVWSFVAHYPELCAGVGCIAVPYMTLELGLQELLTTINRDLYPENEHPNGPWDYQAYYETNFDDVTRFYNADVAGFTKLQHQPGDPAALREPARTAGITKAGGWMGGIAKPPSEEVLPTDKTIFKGREDIWTALRAKMLKTGYQSPNSFYMNHAANRAYTLEKAKNGHVLSLPTLFINARWDAVCSSDAAPKLPEKMRAYCKDLTERSVDAGHHAEIENPEAVNKILEEWVRGKLAGWGTEHGVRL